MKNRYAVRILISLFSLLYIQTEVVTAQPTSMLACGDIISDTFTDALAHTYQLQADAETILVVRAEPLPINLSDLRVSVEILTDAGFIIGSTDFMPEDLSTTIETSPLLSSRSLEITVAGTNTGTYQLFVSCVDANGEVTSNNNLVQGLTCGDEIDNAIARDDELHRFYISLNQEDSLVVRAITLEGQFGDLTIDTGMFSPSNQELDSINPMFKGIEREFDTGPLPENGVYRIYLRAFDSSEGEYRLSVACTLANGATVIAGQNPRRELTPTILSEQLAVTPTAEAIQPNTVENLGSGGFASVDSIASIPVNLDAGITIPLIASVPNTGSIDADFEGIFGFRTSTEANSTMSMDFQRLSGNLPLGLVIFSGDGQIIFRADLFNAAELSTQITLPQSADYTVGVYRLDSTQPQTPETTSFTINATIEP